MTRYHASISRAINKLTDSQLSLPHGIRN